METDDTQKGNIIEKIARSSETPEHMAAYVMTTIEVLRSYWTYPNLQHLRMSSPDTVPVEIKESFVNQHIGDMLEVAVLFSATRLALSCFNEVLKKITHKEIPDEARFWAL